MEQDVFGQLAWEFARSRGANVPGGAMSWDGKFFINDLELSVYDAIVAQEEAKIQTSAMQSIMKGEEPKLGSVNKDVIWLDTRLGTAYEKYGLELS